MDIDPILSLQEPRPPTAPPALSIHRGLIRVRSISAIARTRAEPIKDGGMTVPPPMASANAINLQPTGGGKAAITGDFVLIAKEVNPVLKTLRGHPRNPSRQAHRDAFRRLQAAGDPDHPRRPSSLGLSVEIHH
jgi:Domain of Unknown Function (DUF1259)